MCLWKWQKKEISQFSTTKWIGNFYTNEEQKETAQRTNNLKNENKERLANKIIALAVDIKRRVPNVAVLRSIFRAELQMEHKIRRLIYLVEAGVKEHDINFISQDSIEAGGLDKWGLHLNFYGTDALAGTFLNFTTSQKSCNILSTY